MTAPRTILDLVDCFDYNRDNYRNPQCNETQLRRDFLDPFFTALGWDVENKEGYAKAYKDVVHKDALVYELYTLTPEEIALVEGR